MKLKIKLLTAVFGALLSANSFGAADITLYYSPTCPHCHHLRDFISSSLVYEYPSLNAKMVNLSEEANREPFFADVKKCGFESTGVPVAIINGKCIQGFDTPETSGQEIRDALNAGLTEEEKSAATKATAEFNASPDAYRSAHSERTSAIHEQISAETGEKKTSDRSPIYFYGLLIILVTGLGFVMFSKKKK